MDALDRAEHLSRVQPHPLLGKRALFEVRDQFAAAEVLHLEVDAIVVLKRGVQRRDKGVVHLLENRRFGDSALGRPQVLDLRLFEDLERVKMAAGALPHQHDHAKPTLANLAQHFEVVHAQPRPRVEGQASRRRGSVDLKLSSEASAEPPPTGPQSASAVPSAMCGLTLSPCWSPTHLGLAAGAVQSSCLDALSCLDARATTALTVRLIHAHALPVDQVSPRRCSRQIPAHHDSIRQV